MRQKITTSVIGSYPIPIDNQRLMSNYFTKQDVSWSFFIDQAVQDILTAGVDFVSDGQTRDPFIQLFTRKLGGCRIRDRTEITSKIEYCEPITIDDQHYARHLLPRNKKLIGVITGPYTLAQSCVDLFYHDEKQLCYDFAEAMKKEAELLQRHVDLLSIDEPCFSNGMPEYAADIIGIITKHVSVPTRLHACGDVSHIIPQLLDLPVDMLSHEFKATPALLDKFSQYSCSKKICLGSVRSDDPTIEPVQEIVDHINKGVKIFDKHLIQIAPDCGQRYLPRNVAFQKLQNLVKAGEIINEK
jgi:5-methyltetrahydropteroyltriglutamate--homocysteine methyltransferase